MKGQPFSTRRQFSGFPVPATAKQLESLDLVRQAGEYAHIMVTNHTQNPDAGAGQPFNTPGKLAVGFKEVILVLDHIPGEDHRIHRAGDRLIDDAVPDTRRSNVPGAADEFIR
jgi:hypothetical protein